jgi:ribosomal-protein-alanine N-acetyltransferase
VLTIRPFQATDMFAVIKIASETLTEQYVPNLFNYFYETFPQGFIIAEQHHKIIGFTIGIKITNEAARIIMLSVKHDYQQQQIGTKLLNKLINTLENEKIKQINLEVRTDNEKAIKFYLKHGFKIIDTIKQFYQNGENAFIMKRVIQSY